MCCFLSSGQKTESMSLNLKVPKDTSSAKDRPKTPRRNKSPKSQLDSVSNRTGPAVGGASRAKSKSPNPSFCSVLSRVKDWELGAFTPKTALAENVDVFKGSNVPFNGSDSSCGGDSSTRNALKNKNQAVENHKIH